MQLINSLTFASIVAIPAIGSAITSTSGHSGVVIKTNGRIVLVAVAVSFVVGDTFTDTAEITVYQPRVIPWTNTASTPIPWLNTASTPIPWQSTILDPVQVAVLNYGALIDVYVQSLLTANDTMMSQYANSPVIASVVQSLIDALDPYSTIDDFYNNIWNIDTANEYGLAIWGRIVGVSNVIQVPSLSGYSEFLETGAGTSFGARPLFGSATSTKGLTLTSDAFRLLIKAKAAANITNCSIPSLNAILNMMFPNRGKIFVQSLGNMQMLITCKFVLQPFEITILKNSGVFPVPTGVLMNIMPIANVMLFAETGAGRAFGTAALFGDFA